MLLIVRFQASFVESVKEAKASVCSHVDAQHASAVCKGVRITCELLVMRTLCRSCAVCMVAALHSMPLLDRIASFRAYVVQDHKYVVLAAHDRLEEQAQGNDLFSALDPVACQCCRARLPTGGRSKTAL